MVSLRTEFAGMTLRNPVVIAASPATETVENIIKCCRAGAGAVITKSIADYDPTKFNVLGSRRTYVDRRGMWATSAFPRETLTLENGRRLVYESSRQTEFPVIASVGGLGLEPEQWYPVCREMQEAGASALQLDLFYLPQPVAVPRSLERLGRLVRELAQAVRIPVLPKLSVEIPAMVAAEVFEATGVAGISLLDSVHGPPPALVNEGGAPALRHMTKPNRASIFGSWQMPLTLHYTYQLAANSRLPLCAGGGLMNGGDAAELIMWGASTVQCATAVLLWGYERITRIVSELQLYLERNGLSDIGSLRGRQIPGLGRDGETEFHEARVRVDQEACTMCGRCLDLAFCSAIQKNDGRIQILPDRCDGCNLCTHYCKPGALAVDRLT